MGEYPYEEGEPLGTCASAQMDTTKLPSKGTPHINGQTPLKSWAHAEAHR